MAEYNPNQYVVLKTKDILKYLSSNKKILLDDILQIIKEGRQADGRPSTNEYYVWNLTAPGADKVWKAISDAIDLIPKPCLHCGAPGQLICSEAGKYFVLCTKCTASVGLAVPDAFYPEHVGFSTPEEAVAAWNERFVK